jgi:pimeloyl-ACP methyl ester carboxylesterase
VRNPEAFGRWLRAGAAIGVIVLAALTAAITAPPFADSKTAVGLATLIALLVSGAIYVGMHLFDDKNHLVGWQVAAVVLAVTSIVWIMRYRTLSDEYVATYQGERVVIGKTLTEVGAAWVANHRNESPSELLFDAHGDVYLFWTKESVAEANFPLRVGYFGWFAVVTLALLCLVQSVALVILLKARRVEVAVVPPDEPASDDTGKRPAVVFVHGILSSEACWDELVGLLKKDPRIANRFLLRRFGYDAAPFKLDPRLRIPRLQEIGRALEGFLGSTELHGRQITLVGHSQGGLAILSYLADVVSSGKGEKLSAIRQVILIAPPLQGSTLVSGVRKLISRYVDNPQERQLRVLNPDMSTIMAHIQEQIVAATEPDKATYPVPIRLFYGQSDGIVPEASARGGFTKATPLPGDHSSVIRPSNASDRRYTAIAEALLEPVGHPNVFEVELYEISLTVEPREKKAYSFSYERGESKTVECDNWARLVQAVTFSKGNQCTSPYEFRYATKQHGIIKATTSYVDETPGDERTPYEDSRESFITRFKPAPEKTYRFELEVYKGFDEGQRNIARRLVRPAYYQNVMVRLNLKAYLDGGFVVSRYPEMSVDTQYKVSANPQHFETPTKGKEIESGIWRWELHDIREGVVRVTWDVARA